MPSLHELQRSFCAATIFDDVAAVAGLAVVSGTLEPGTRIGIYRANIFGNYRRALAATYPVIKRLVGAPFFDAACDHFVCAHPSTRGDINRYGGDFCRFLGEYGPARDLKYLPDVARLEWAVDQANIAADADAFDIAALAAVPADLHGELRFHLHPSAQLVVSMFPILHIWRVNQAANDTDERIDLDEGGDAVLVVRRSAGAGGIVIERITPSEHLLLGLLGAGLPLGEAADRCAAMSSKFDLAATLQRHAVARTIVGFRAPAAVAGCDSVPTAKPFSG